MSQNANSNGPSTTELEAFIAQIDHMATLLGEGHQALTIEDRKRMLKARKGSDAVIEKLARLYKEHGLASHSTSTDAMLAHLASAKAVLPLAEHVRKLSRLVDDMILVSMGECWTQAISTYRMIRAAAMTNPALETDVAELRDFFRTRKPRAAKAEPKQPETPAAEAPSASGASPESPAAAPHAPAP